MPYVTTGTYEKALASYIDLLGFAELINDSLSNPLKVAKIASLLTTMRHVPG
jgi:hypothetical protein